MTSWIKRIQNCKTVLESLLNQELKADYIELNLSLEEFPQKENDLPKDLVVLITSNPTIQINWVEGNSGVFKKIIPTIQKFYGCKYYLLSVDDDWLYRSDYVRLMINYLEKYKTDAFCLANANVIGNRQIYKSSCFKKDFWEKLTQEVIDTRIDDTYIEYYLKCKGKTISHFRPSDTPDITKKFNPVAPNSRNTVDGAYSIQDIHAAQMAVAKINFEQNQKKTAIFTCITGGYDTPCDDFEHVDGFDYIMFSDVPIQTNSWKNFIISFDTDTLSQVKKQRYIKTHPHVILKDYDIAVWIDANTSVDDKLYKYIEENKNNAITFKKHPDRDCIYDEIKEVVLRGKENKKIGEFLYNRYQKEEFPNHYGLYETNIIISHPNSEGVQNLFEKWWGEIYKNSHRDQLSLNYIIWKYNLKEFISETASKHFKPKNHNGTHKNIHHIFR